MPSDAAGGVYHGSGPWFCHVPPVYATVTFVSTAVLKFVRRRYLHLNTDSTLVSALPVIAAARLLRWSKI